MQAAVVQDPVVPADGTISCQVVQIQPAVNQLALLQGELQLVEHQRLADIFLQQFQLARCHIADAETADLSAFLQLIKRFSHFLRVEQQIRPVKQQHIQVISLQPAKAPLSTCQDIFFAPVKLFPVKMQTAFALNKHILPFQAG